MSIYCVFPSVAFRHALLDLFEELLITINNEKWQDYSKNGTQKVSFYQAITIYLFYKSPNKLLYKLNIPSKGEVLGL